MKQRTAIQLNIAFFLMSVFYHVTTVAAMLNIWPVELRLWPALKSDVVHITNRGSEVVNVQLLAKTWDIDENGRFIETGTGDFVFFPRLLTLQPKEERAVRVGYNGEFPSLEKSYRLYIEELPPVLPPEQQEKGYGLRYLLRLSLPIFVMPSQESPEPELEVDEIRVAKKTVKNSTRPTPFSKPHRDGEKPLQVIQVGIRAPGNYHVQVRLLKLEWLDKDSKTVVSTEASDPLLRVLPHRRVFVDVPVPENCKGASSLRVIVHAQGEKSAYSRSFSLKHGQCYP